MRCAYVKCAEGMGELSTILPSRYRILSTVPDAKIRPREARSCVSQSRNGTRHSRLSGARQRTKEKTMIHFEKRRGKYGNEWYCVSWPGERTEEETSKLHRAIAERFEHEWIGESYHEPTNSIQCRFEDGMGISRSVTCAKWHCEWRKISRPMFQPATKWIPSHPDYRDPRNWTRLMDAMIKCGCINTNHNCSFFNAMIWVLSDPNVWAASNAKMDTGQHISEHPVPDLRAAVLACAELYVSGLAAKLGYDS